MPAILKFKSGVIGYPQGPLLHAILTCQDIYDWFGQLELTVTSLRDGAHMKDSLHARGYAADLRTSTIAAKQRPAIAAAIKSAVGPAYDVVLESDHIHIEYDPEHNGGANLPDLPAPTVT